MSKQIIRRKIGSLLLCMIMLFSVLGGALPITAVAADQGPVTVTQAIDDASAFLMNQVGTSLTAWDAYALAKANKPVPASYLTSVNQQLLQVTGNFTNVTDYARIALAVKAAGGNPENAAGYNLIEKIYNNDRMTLQGTNGAIYALLALNSGTYIIPNNAKWNPDLIIAWLLSQKNADGGWSLASGGQSSVDITSAALASLAPYKARSEVQLAINAGVSWLSSHQLNNGGFNEYGENSESAAQVSIALSALGIDARSADFTKADGNLISYLFTYRQTDGGFSHLKGQASDVGATGQILTALAAYRIFTGGNSGSYNAVLTTGGSVIPTKAYVTVHVEGPKGVIAEGTEQADNGFDALTQLLIATGLPYHATAAHYVDSINSDANTAISSTNSSYWLYNVKRQGEWDYAQTNQLGLYDYKVKNGDNIYVYYSANDTQLVQSITTDPLAPEPNKPFSIKVQQTVWDWVYSVQTTTVAANVYVNIGRQTVQTNSQGISLFTSGLPEGSYEATVSGTRNGLPPSIVRATKNVIIGTTNNASIRVEGSTNTYAIGTTNAGNLFTNLQELLTSKNVPFQVVGKYVKVIGHDADNMNFAVYRQGKWDFPQVGMADYVLQNGDQAVIYASGYDASFNPLTFLTNSITLNPLQPQANDAFTIKVMKTSGYDVPSPAEGIQVQIGSLISITNNQGIASFSGLNEGTYTLDISGYVPGGAPKIVHSSSIVTIAPKVSSIGGGVIVPSVSLTVNGDSGTGTILGATSSSLQNGDTPFSVLVRTLGSSRVQSTGSGMNAYVSGIDGLKEFDKGPLSGWMYSVNGSYLSLGANSYILKSGDTVIWSYTVNSGNDLKGASQSNSTPSGVTTPAATGSVATDVSTAFQQQTGLSYANERPIAEVATTAAIIHADRAMSASLSDQLSKDLAANTVNMQKDVALNALTTLTDAKEEVKLRIPAQALSSNTTVSVKELSSDGRKELVSSMYEFEPKGLKFDNPVYITLKIPLASEHTEQLAFVWLNEQTNQWIPIPAVIDAETGEVTGMVDHFTKFAIVNKTKLLPSLDSKVSTAIDKAVKQILTKEDLTDWEALALAKAGNVVPKAYLLAVENALKEHKGEYRNVTDYERMALGVKAAGGNPNQIAGYNLSERIYNNDRMNVQGTNGPIYALLALQSAGTEVPSNAKWTTETLLQTLLQQQNTDGSWPLAQGEQGNVDLTAAALSAVSFYSDRKEIKAATDKALLWLASQLLSDGGFALAGEENSESTAQVIWGVTASGINPTGDLFSKSANNMIDNLLSFQQSDGGFAHQIGGVSDRIATQQALLALASYRSFIGMAAPQNTVNVSTPQDQAYTDAAEIAAWALPFVNKATSYKLMEGTNANVPRFEPKKEITRSEFTAILLRLLGEPPTAGTTTSFADVAPDAWYASYIVKAVEKGLVQGISASTFAPDRMITRQEMAIMLGRALKLDGKTASAATSFSDLNAAYPEAVLSIQAVAERGIMVGDDVKQFLPQSFATREMAATVVVRAYELNLQK